MKKFIAFLHKWRPACRAHHRCVTGHRMGPQWQSHSDQITEAAGFAKDDGIDFDAATCQPSGPPSTTGTRSGTTTTSTVTGTNDNPIRGNVSTETDPATIARQAADAALAAERARVSEIRALGRTHEIANSVIDASIDGGHTIDQARAAFLEAMRQSRQAGVPPSISRGGALAGSQGVRILQAACLMRAGIDPDMRDSQQQRRQQPCIPSGPRHWLACHAGQRGERRDNLEQVYDQVRQTGLHNASMMRLAQECYELETGQRAPYQTDELLQWLLGGRRSSYYSSANFSVIWGATVHMMLWAGYASAPATYERFCDIGRRA